MVFNSQFLKIGVVQRLPMLCAVFLVRRLGFNSLNSGQRIKNQARQFFSRTKSQRFSEFYSRILENYSRRIYSRR